MPSAAPTALSPVVGTGEATLLDNPANSVQLNGYFTYPAGTNVTTFYEYGPCPLGNGTVSSTPAVSTIATGSAQAAPSANVSGLAAGEYCTRLVAMTDDGTGNPVYTYGNPSTFQISGPPHVEVVTNPASTADQPAGTATLNGEVVFPPGTPLQYYFEVR